MFLINEEMQITGSLENSRTTRYEGYTLGHTASGARPVLSLFSFASKVRAQSCELQNLLWVILGQPDQVKQYLENQKSILFGCVCRCFQRGLAWEFKQTQCGRSPSLRVALSSLLGLRWNRTRGKAKFSLSLSSLSDSLSLYLCFCLYHLSPEELWYTLLPCSLTTTVSLVFGHRNLCQQAWVLRPLPWSLADSFHGTSQSS